MLATDLAYVREVRLDDRGNLVVAGTGFASDGTARVELVLGDRSGDRGALRRRYEGDEEGLARFVHDFVDDVVEALTARRSAFVSRLAFARRVGAGRKDIYTIDADGANLERVSSGRGVATLPAISPDGLFYTVVTPTSVFITRTGTDEQPVIGGPGVHMGATVCDGRLFFSSARDGNTDIYSAQQDGSGEQRLTDHAAIEVSPTCGPDGRLAFVSDRTGTPQIWVMQRDGTRERQVTREGSATQTPAWCGDQMAFTAVGNGPMRIMVMDLRTATVRRVSPPGAAYKDPAFSPDCRMIAFTSPRGVEIATPDGRLRRLVAPGHAETVRWAPVSREH
jgi:TolB protein